MKVLFFPYLQLLLLIKERKVLASDLLRNGKKGTKRIFLIGPFPFLFLITHFLSLLLYNLDKYGSNLEILFVCSM